MKSPLGVVRLILLVFLFTSPALAQLIDNTLAPNTAKAGINKSLADEVGTGRGDVMTPYSSLFIINRDPFRSIRRGRQIFQRKFTRAQGQGPNNSDGTGDINTIGGIGAGLSDSCAGCHGRPRGTAGAGGDVATRPDSRDAPHLFGLGLKEMLADEITTDLRAIRAQAIAAAQAKHQPVTKQLISKTINYGSIAANPDGTVDISKVSGVNADLRVRPFFAEGSTISMREFLVGAFRNEMGIEAADPDLLIASSGGKVTTPSGMVLDGSLDKIEAPPVSDPGADPDGDRVTNELPVSLIDHMEFYLLHYFKPGVYKQTEQTDNGRKMFAKIGCASCHIPNLQINHDRRIADVNTVYDPVHGNFNNLFAMASAFFDSVDDGSGFPALKKPKLQSFLVTDIYTDFKRHDVGPGFYERNYDGTITKQFLTRPLWGVGSTSPYGHDGRSINLDEVILRHGGEAQGSRDAYARLDGEDQAAIDAFLNSLIIFPPEDTASNLDPGNRNLVNFPQFGHGSIKLTVLFNDPSDPE
jgi:Di-haem oxidoreductase, putative peroxidase